MRVDASPVAVPSQDFSVVYGRWMPALTRYCRTILRSDADAEDAAQNAMLKAMDALAAGPAPDHLPSWLHRIARNESISLMRRRQDAVALEDHDEATGATTEEVAATRRRLGDLLTDLRALPTRQREALVLRELDGLSHRSIAAQLGITEAAAQQAVLDARRSLHAYADGRALACDRVQTWLSAHEHARLRSRGVRAHLRDCGTCTDFAGALRTRPRDLAALLPVAGAGGLVARIAALFAAAPAGAQVALGLGVLATAGAGLTIELPSAPGRGAPDRSVAAAPRTSSLAPPVVGLPLPGGTVASDAVRSGGRVVLGPGGRRVARADRGGAAAAGGDGAAAGAVDATDLPPAGAAGPAAAAGTGGSSSSGSSGASSGDGGSPSRPSPSRPSGGSSSGSGGSTSTSGGGAGGSVTQAAPTPVADAVAPTVQAVEEAVAPVTKVVEETVAPVTQAVQTATQQTTGTVQQVVDDVSAADPTGTVGQVVGVLGGG
jgi:RNA polymerase sigma factor (sigma-70 family)